MKTAIAIRANERDRVVILIFADADLRVHHYRVAGSRSHNTVRRVAHSDVHNRSSKVREHQRLGSKPKCNLLGSAIRRYRYALGVVGLKCESHKLVGSEIKCVDGPVRLNSVPFLCDWFKLQLKTFVLLKRRWDVVYACAICVDH